MIETFMHYYLFSSGLFCHTTQASVRLKNLLIGIHISKYTHPCSVRRANYMQHK